MKICFLASIREKDKLVSDYKGIVDILKSFADKVFCEHVLNHSQEDLDGLSEEDRVKFHKGIIDYIKKADIVVAEATSQSMGVGYLVSMALDFSKPTILLFKGDKQPNILSFIEQSDRLFVCKYGDGIDLKTILSEKLGVAKGSADVRFNFFVSPKILEFLDWIAKDRKVPRSVFLRDLIEKEMKKEKRFEG